MFHSFDSDFAVKYGITEAIIFNYLSFCTQVNEANDRNFFEERFWTHNTYKAFTRIFPYLSERQIRYTLQKLKDAGLIISGNFNASPYDKTAWYALSDLGLSMRQNCHIEKTEVSHLHCTIKNPIDDRSDPPKSDDLPKPKRPRKKPTETEPIGFDPDDFFEAALKRSYSPKD